MADYTRDLNEAKAARAKLIKKPQNKRTAADFERITQLGALINELKGEQSPAAQAEVKSLKAEQADAIVDTAQAIVAEMTDEQVQDLLASKGSNLMIDPSPETPGDYVQVRRSITSDCETAREEGCTCRCREKYHGQPHPRGWKDEEGCGPLTKAEKKIAKKRSLYAWRAKNPQRVSSYMKAWRIEKKAKEKEEVAPAVAEEETGNGE